MNYSLMRIEKISKSRGNGLFEEWLACRLSLSFTCFKTRAKASGFISMSSRKRWMNISFVDKYAAADAAQTDQSGLAYSRRCAAGKSAPVSLHFAQSGGASNADNKRALWGLSANMPTVPMQKPSARLG